MRYFSSKKERKKYSACLILKGAGSFFKKSVLYVLIIEEVEEAESDTYLTSFVLAANFGIQGFGKLILI